MRLQDACKKFAGLWIEGNKDKDKVVFYGPSYEFTRNSRYFG